MQFWSRDYSCAIVTSLVNDIIMPLVGVLLGGIDFNTLSIQVGEATIAYGKFIQAGAVPGCKGITEDRGPAKSNHKDTKTPRFLVS